MLLVKRNRLLRRGLSIAAKHRHNADNDASYALRVMVAIVAGDVQNKRSAEERKFEKRRDRIKAAWKVTRTMVCAELEG